MQEIPKVAFGTWRLYGEEAQLAVSCALHCGYRHVDTASIYKNEDSVGRALRAFAEGSGDPVFVTSKCSTYQKGWVAEVDTHTQPRSPFFLTSSLVLCVRHVGDAVPRMCSCSVTVVDGEVCLCAHALLGEWHKYTRHDSTDMTCGVDNQSRKGAAGWEGISRGTWG